MIVKDSSWVHSYNLKNELEDPDSTGKWLIWDNLGKIKGFFPKIDVLVDQGVLYMAKYTHKKNKLADRQPFEPPVCCVYADNLTKDRIYRILEQIGITPKEWKYDSETREDWKPGGEFNKKSYWQQYVAFCEFVDEKKKKEKQD